MNDDDAQYFTPTDWQTRLNEQADAYRTRQANRKAQRDDKARRRNYGLVARHAAKQARNRTQTGETR